MNIFESASKRKLRFQTSKGSISSEELWDLSLTSLDTLAKAVNRSIKDSQEESFLTPKSQGDSEQELRLEILKHIIVSKQAAAEASRLRTERLAKLETLKGVLASKQMDVLAQKSLEDLQKEVAELEAAV